MDNKANSSFHRYVAQGIYSVDWVFAEIFFTTNIAASLMKFQGSLKEFRASLKEFRASLKEFQASLKEFQASFTSIQDLLMLQVCATEVVVNEFLKIIAEFMG